MTVSNPPSDEHSSMAARAADLFLEELEQGKEPSVSEYMLRFPTLGKELPEMLDAVRLLAEPRLAAGAEKRRPLARKGDGRHDHDDHREKVSSLPGAGCLGDYKLVREVGRGGMGVVYEAEQISLGRRVALKVLPFAAVLDDRQIRRFKNEAQAAAQLHHPHIVPVFAVGCDRGTHYYAMQFIEGRTVADFIRMLRGQRDADHVLAPTEALPLAARVTVVPTEKRSKSKPTTSKPATSKTAPRPGLFSGYNQRTKCAAGRSQETVGDDASKSAIHSEDYFRRIAQIGVEAGEALDHAHDLGVVHRDVKPSNLLLDANGAVWVTDFGLARYQSDLNLTMTGELVGTLGYMSPEQARGKRVIDHRTDVYSLGVTLRELLTLEPAFTDAAGQELLRRIAEDEPPAPRSINPDVPIDLETIILKAMAKEPEQRYESALEVVEDLQRFLDNKPIRARPPTLIERTIRWGRRHAKIVAAAMAFLFASSLVLMAASLIIWRAKEQKAQALVLLEQKSEQLEQQSARAESNLRRAREIVDTLGTRFSDRLSETPGAEQIRRELLGETLKYHRQFISQAAGQPSMQAELAASYFRVGGITQQLGSALEALPPYEEAQQIWLRLVADHPNEKSYSRDLALCLNDVGLLLVQLQREQEAEGAFCKAISMLDQLRRKDPTDPAVSAGLAMCYNNAGLLYSRTEKRAAARAAYRAAIEIQERLVANFPEEPQHQSDLALSENNLATLLRETEPNAAKEAYTKAVELQTNLSKKQVGKLSLRADLAVTYSNLGSLSSRLNRPDDAATSYDDAIRIQEELVKLAPHQTKHRNDLAVSLNNLGFLQTQQKRFNPAVETFERAKTILAGLVKDFPEMLAYHSSLGGTYNNLGMALEELGRNEEALGAYTSAVKSQQIAFDGASHVPQFRDFLSTHLVNQARVQRELGRIDDAAQAARARRKLWPHDGERLYGVACELALAAGTFAKKLDDPKTEGNRFEHLDVKREGLMREALDVLKQAVEVGLQNRTRALTDAAWSACPNRIELQRVLKLDSIRPTSGPRRVAEPVTAPSDG